MFNIFLGLLRILKLPVKLLKGWLRRKRKKTTEKDELHRKLRTHVWNFAPGRLKNVSWQKSFGGRKKGKKKRKFSGKKANNLTKKA